ncbi:MAG: hypothetical protein IPN93_02455 [Bacteroidetes bacterium]|nr:hypothetical protein [Bacteroidota bacterium]
MPREKATFDISNRCKNLSHWDLKEKAADFSYLKSLVDRVLRKLGISGFKLEERENPEFEFGVEYWLGE